MRPTGPRRLLVAPLLLTVALALAGCREATVMSVVGPTPSLPTSVAAARPATPIRPASTGTPPRAPSACPVTPYAAGPPANSAGDRAIGGLRPYRWYGGDGLWAFPWLQAEPAGVLYLDEHGLHKVLWWREPGVEGPITVATRRLDGPSATAVVDFEGLPTQQGQQPGGLLFPTAGCWAISGTAGGKHLTIVAFLVAAPSTPASVSDPPTPRPAAGTADTRVATPAATPAACAGDTARTLLARFLDAFDRGDTATLAAFLTARHADLGVSRPGEERLLHWYAVAGPAPVYARTRAEALDYFAARHARREHLRLTAVHYAEYERDAIVGITFALTREADDLPTHPVIAKAAFSCTDGTIVQWAMGPEDARP